MRPVKIDLKKQRQPNKIDNQSSSKKLDLTKQFQEFKHRIQEFEKKNDEIIGKIREAYNFKKRTLQKEDPELIYDKSRVIHYQNQEANHEDSSCDYSNNLIYDGNLVKQLGSNYYPHPEQQQTKSAKMPPLNQYSTSNFLQVNTSTSMKGHPKQKKLFNYEDYMQHNNPNKSASQSQVFSRLSGEKQTKNILTRKDGNYEFNDTGNFYEQGDYARLQQLYKQELGRNMQLEEEMLMMSEDYQKMKNIEIKFKSYVNSVKMLVESNLENFQEEVIQKSFFQIQRSVKKCEVRLKNIGYDLRDKIQEVRSIRIIKQSRTRRKSRSKSRSRQANSSISSIDNKERQSAEKNKVRSVNTKQGLKRKDFEEMASQYELMIKQKKGQNQHLQKRIAELIESGNQATLELQKNKLIIIEKEKLLQEKDKQIQQKNLKQNGRQQLHQIDNLKAIVAQLEEQIKQSELKQQDLEESIKKIQISKKLLHEEYLQNLSKNKQSRLDAIQKTQKRIKELEKIIENKNCDILALKEKNREDERIRMEKECEVYALTNKIKKLENDNKMKEVRILDFEKAILKENEGDILEKSMSIDSIYNSVDIKSMQDTIKQLEEQLEDQKNNVFALQKEKNFLQSRIDTHESEKILLQKILSQVQIQISQLKQKQAIQQKQFNDDERESVHDIIQERDKLTAEIGQMIMKNDHLTTQNRKLKEENLNIQRNLIKVNSELSFTKDQINVISTKNFKLKDEYELLRINLLDKQSELKRVEFQFKSEIDNYRLQIDQLRTSLAILQKGDKDELIEQNLLNSCNASEISLNITRKRYATEEQNIMLKEELRKSEIALEINKKAQEEMDRQYKLNLQKLKSQLIQKNKDIQRLAEQAQHAHKQMNEIKREIREQASFENYKLSVYEEKIILMEEQMRIGKENEERLNDMLHQLFQSSKDKQDQRNRLSKQLQKKDRQIIELKDLLELKDIKLQSNRSMKEGKEIKDSHFSFKLSGFHSEDNSELNQLSYLSNISDVFKRDEALQQRIKKGKTTREEQVKLFEKTSTYIKSLKAMIDSKDKRIKLLQKQIVNFKLNSGIKWAQNANDKIEKQQQKDWNEWDEREEVCEQYKDYDSVQVDTRKSKYLEIVKQLQNEKILVNQENKMLLEQIQFLQLELVKAEEQQNTLLNIKDLYKQQIKNLVEGKEAQLREFQTQIDRMRQALQESESYHNLETIKQLFLRIIFNVAFMEDQSNKANKRQQKRKELQECIKVMSSVLKIDGSIRQKLIFSIRK